MKKEEKALIYFRDLRERKIKDYSLVFNVAPKDSVVYEAVSAEIEIYDTVIKALEQEPILDKIRAEIEQKARPYEIGGRGNGKSIRYGLCVALQFIDKYKAESEG